MVHCPSCGTLNRGGYCNDRCVFIMQTRTLTERKPEMKINYMILKDSIVVNFDAQTISINKRDSRYNNVLLAIKEGRLEDIPELASVKKTLEIAGFQVVNGLVTVDGKALPDALNSSIVEFMEQGLPFAPLLKFWDNLKLNPSFNSKEMLYSFLEHNGHPLTEDGHFIAYRGVTTNFKDKHTGKFDNSPGAICEMPREDVDDNPNNTCSSGLHVAAFKYASDFGPVVVEVKVNPKDVVAVPVDYDGTKMRVCRFEVLAETEKMRDETVYGVDKTEREEVTHLDDEDESDIDMNWYQSEEFYDSYGDDDDSGDPRDTW